MTRSTHRHFSGLDSLRCFAALLVVIGHIPMNQASVGLPSQHYGAIFYRSGPAVSFFFALSGFLITFLLLQEQQRTGTISIRSFYLRRILRIWPLYFLVIGFGLTFYNALLPALRMDYAVEYNLGVAVLLYVFFLPNLMNSLYTVGGILNPSWSIGIEEQFYLLWAPLTKRAHRKLPAICLLVLALSLSNFALAYLNPFDLRAMQKFFLQLKFHFLAAGALVGWAYHACPERLLSSRVFTTRWLQWGIAAFLLQYIVVNAVPLHWFLEECLQLALFAWLLVEIALNPRRRLRITNPITEYLGHISYGIYMYHMIAIYLTSWLFLRTDWWHGRTALYLFTYYSLAIGLTTLISAASHRFFEGPFLRLKPAVGPAQAISEPTPSARDGVEAQAR